jgi:cell division transport system ATP-binding protein
MNNNAITIQDVNFGYDEDKLILKNLSLAIPKGKIVAIMGGSGSGKTTLLRLITKQFNAQSGTINVFGQDINSLSENKVLELRKRIGVLFQFGALFTDYTVFENVAFALEIVGMSNKEIRHTVPKVLEIVGLKGKGDNYPSELSGGERQRVAIARAIVRQPKILIADEPTGNLDPKHAWDVIRVLEKINRYGTTVLLTTHNKEIVDKLKRRVVTIKDGKIADDRAGSEYRL